MPTLTETFIVLASLGVTYAAILWVITKSKTNLIQNHRLMTALKAAAAIALGTAGSYAAFHTPAIDQQQSAKHLHSP